MSDDGYDDLKQTYQRAKEQHAAFRAANGYDRNDPPDAPTRSHGGARAGSGQPRLDEDDPTVSITLTVPGQYAAWLLAYGQGNRSAGLRKLIEHAIGEGE